MVMKAVDLKLLALAVLLVLFSCTEKVEDFSMGAGITVSRIDYSDTASIKVMVVPDSGCERFEYAIGSEADYEAFDAGILDGMVTVAGDESCEAFFDGLEANTVYTVYARAYLDGILGGIATVKVRTDDNNVSVKLQYAIDGSAGFLLKISEEYSGIRYYLGAADDREQFFAGELEDGFIADMVDYRGIGYFDLEDKEYVFYAMAYDLYGNGCKLYEIPVNLSAETSQKFTSSFEIRDIDMFRGHYRVSSNENCAKLTCVVGLGGEYSGRVSSFNGDYISWLSSWERIPDLVHSFSSNSNVLEFELDDEMFLSAAAIDAYVLIYDTEYNPVGVQHFQLNKPEVNSSLPDAHVTISVSEITSSGAKYTYVPDENTLGFYYDTIDADWFDEFSVGEEYYDTYIHDLVRPDHMFVYTGCLDGKSSFVFEETTGEPCKRYYAMACPVNGNGPGENGWGPLVTEEYITAEN